MVAHLIGFFVPGKPQGKGRPRFSRNVVYTPKETLKYEKLIASCFTGNMLQGPLFVDITAFFSIPKSYTKTQKKAIEDGILTPTKKPDADNIGKVVMDALNGIAYEDDKQVIDLRISKIYSASQEGLEIIIGEAYGQDQTR